jgi:hypothetical protein
MTIKLEQILNEGRKPTANSTFAIGGVRAPQTVL